MGRKRVARGKTREPITISLPRDLIIQFDATLPEEHTRSRLIESLIRRHLSVNTTLESFKRHAYECLNCGRSWHQSKKHNPEWMICGGPRGCEQMNISYIGVYVEGEEE